MNDVLNFKSITTYRVALPLKFEFKTAKGTVRVRESIIVRIEDQQGYVGYGECVAFTDPFYTAETVDSAWKRLVDTYILELRLMRPKPLMAYIRQLQFWLKRDNMPMTIAGLENALINLDCNRKGVNSVSYINGCKRIKLKVSPRDGYERTRLVREAYPELALAVDANQSYTYDQLDMVAAYNNLQLLCIEEPFTMTNLITYKAWKESVPDWPITSPICLDESILSYDDLSYAIEHRLIDVLNVKVGRLGGLIQTRAAILRCREAGIPYWIGSMVESGISKTLHVQLSALGDTYMAGDLSDSNRYFEHDLIDPEILFIDGVMQVPNGNGLGVDVLDSRIEEYSVEKRTL
ncbi:MAG: o-succinylbenzoate synthase [Veillonella sp.]|nr:o-succinylbenzoate synthase [Veillonella sp.]